MRKIIIALTILAFFTCLILGLFASNLIPGLDQTSDSKSAINSPASPFQHNILMVHVDSLLAENPQLVSVWGAILYFPEPKIILQLLYPLDFDQDATIRASFALTAAKDPVSGFLKKINQTTEIQWDHFLVVDQQTMATILTEMTLATGVKVNDPSAMDGQAEITFYKQVCAAIFDQGKYFLNDFVWSEIIPMHIRTDLPVDTALVIWEKLSSTPNPIQCHVYEE